MNIDQIAFCTQDPEALKTLLQTVFGENATQWQEDHVVANGLSLIGTDMSQCEYLNEANLSFNYDLVKGGVEFELLHYEDGPNWLDKRGITNGLSHLGVHVEDLTIVKQLLLDQGYKIAQEVRTKSHTNPAIKDTRRYWYCIFDTRDVLGFDLKLIQRLPL